MKIYNKEKTQILINPDLTNGYLVDEKILKKEAKEEKFHFEEIRYKNGGIARIPVIDSPYIPPEFEEIKVYIPFSNEEKIFNLKQWFDSFYTKNEQKFRRLHTLGLKCDDGSEPIEKLKQLYSEAEEKRKEIQRLEQGGDENGTLYDNTL